MVLDPLTTIPQASIFESLSRFTVLGVVDVEIESSSSLSLTRGRREIKPLINTKP